MTPDPNDPDGLVARERREPVIEEFELAWQNGRPRIEDYLPREPEDARGALFRDLLTVELAYRRRLGETPSDREYAKRFPPFEEIVAQLVDRTSAQAGRGPMAAPPRAGFGRECGSPTGT